MTTYIRYNNTPTIEEWANRTLTPEDLAQFEMALAENNSLWESYFNQGMISASDVFETVFSNVYNTNVEVRIAHKIVVSDTQQNNVVIAPSYVHWLDRFNAEVGNPVIINPDNV